MSEEGGNEEGPLDKNQASPDEVWKWLLIPTPPNATAEQKLIMMEVSDLSDPNGWPEDYMTPIKVFEWDYMHRHDKDVKPRWRT